MKGLVVGGQREEKRWGGEDLGKNETLSSWPGVLGGHHKCFLTKHKKNIILILILIMQ